jgi:DNA-binding winged helix-turn-helix (wHTH) protein
LLLKKTSQTEQLISKDIRIVPSQNRVIINGQDAVVQPKVMQLLVLLCNAQGETITKQQLVAAIWPDVVVSPESLANIITKLRRVLNDSVKQPKYV